MKNKKKYCGYITILGKPNVGKSTLINHIIGKKISIVSNKKNTTQKNIIGIKTEEYYQFIYIDTPGMIFYESKYTIQEKENYKIIKNSTLIIFILDRIYWTENDEIILNKIKKHNIPVIVLINKIDKISNKNILLPYINDLKAKMNFIEIIPISIKKVENMNALEKIIKSYLPKNNHIYHNDYITTNSEFFTISEIIREQVILRLGDELPSIIKVTVESLKKTETGELHIKSIIHVKNIQQKKILIGVNGIKIKNISMVSRSKIEKNFYMKTHLSLWVKTNLLKK